MGCRCTQRAYVPNSTDPTGHLTVVIGTPGFVHFGDNDPNHGYRGGKAWSHPSARSLDASGRVGQLIRIGLDLQHFVLSSGSERDAARRSFVARAQKLLAELRSTQMVP